MRNISQSGGSQSVALREEYEVVDEDHLSVKLQVQLMRESSFKSLKQTICMATNHQLAYLSKSAIDRIYCAWSLKATSARAAMEGLAEPIQGGTTTMTMRQKRGRGSSVPIRHSKLKTGSPIPFPATVVTKEVAAPFQGWGAVG
jgi:hypothetical protein